MKNLRKEQELRKQYVHRSAKTGRFITKKQAVKRPKTTVKEQVWYKR
jgi:hypothetical protein